MIIFPHSWSLQRLPASRHGEKEGEGASPKKIHEDFIR
jgi:hypothetical protein